MSSKFRLTFRGLCAFVPNSEEEKTMWVLMIDPHSIPEHSEHREHEAYVRFHKSTLDKATVELTPPDSEGYYKWMLNGDDLRIKVNGKELPSDSVKPKEIIIKGGDDDFSLI